VIDRANPLQLARAAMLPAACVGVMTYFAFHALSGNAGLLAWQNYKVEHAATDKQAAQVAATKTSLQRQVTLLDPRHVDKDYADERVRRDLGVK
jgi:cell division protein FtsB